MKSRVSMIRMRTKRFARRPVPYGVAIREPPAPSPSSIASLAFAMTATERACAIPSCLRRPAPFRGTQKSDQQQRRGGPLEPDFVQAAEHVDRKQEDGDRDQD